MEKVALMRNSRRRTSDAGIGLGVVSAQSLEWICWDRDLKSRVPKLTTVHWAHAIAVAGQIRGLTSKSNARRTIT